METRKIRVLRSFFYNRTPQPKGAILELKAMEAAAYVSSNQAEYIKETPPPQPAPAQTPPAESAALQPKPKEEEPLPAKQAPIITKKKGGYGHDAT